MVLIRQRLSRVVAAVTHRIERAVIDRSLRSLYRIAVSGRRNAGRVERVYALTQIAVEVVVGLLPLREKRTHLLVVPAESRRRDRLLIEFHVRIVRMHRGIERRGRRVWNREVDAVARGGSADRGPGDAPQRV